MKRRRRIMHPDDPMTWVTWLILATLAAEVATFLWISGAIRPLSPT